QGQERLSDGGRRRSLPRRARDQGIESCRLRRYRDGGNLRIRGQGLARHRRGRQRRPECPRQRAACVAEADQGRGASRTGVTRVRAMATGEAVDLVSPLPPEAIAYKLQSIMADPMEDAKARVFGSGDQYRMRLRYARRG